MGYSDDGAVKRTRVARLAKWMPPVLEELRTGAILLTGSFVPFSHLTEQNAETLLGEARGKTRRELENLVARWFPRPAYRVLH